MSLFGRASGRELTQAEDEQVSNFIQNFLNSTDHTTRDEILREAQQQQQERQSIRVQNSHTLQFFKNVIDIIGFGLFPILLARIIKRLLSAVTFSHDILQDIFEFYNNYNELSNNIMETSLINKFCHIIMYEFGTENLNNWIKLLTIGVYVIYSITISSYMIFTFVFYFLCLVLTTTRRWSEIDKFLVNVFKNSNGVFS